MRGPVAVPPWLRTVRVRLALTYSGLLFGVTAVLLLGIYLALSQTVAAEPLDAVTVKKFSRMSDGTVVYRPGEQFQAADLASVQKAVNYAALQTVRNYSIVALVIMFGLSLVIGWWVAGRVLRPVQRITTAARTIGAGDLSRRIAMTGPQDELRTLGDTVDGMLDRLDHAFRAERVLVEDVSHELRNPVAVIQANVEAVLARPDTDAAERAEAAAVVTRATGRMSRLLDDLLATARKRSEAFVDTEVDLAAVAGAAVHEHQWLAAERDVQLEQRLSAGPVVYGDPASLERALSNLLSNAVRLAPGGSRVSVVDGSVSGWAYVAVRDQGPGIDPDEQDRVFERFHRGPGAAPGGTGLGLAIARQIAESHDGRLVLTSTPGPGSTFVLWLPERALAGAPERGAAPPSLDPLGPQ